MWMAASMKRTMAILVGMTGFMVVLIGGPVHLEGDGYQVAGKDGPAFRVDPGKTMTLHFTKGSAEAPLTMMSPLVRHVIWCDMHPDVKGELFIIERRG